MAKHYINYHKVPQPPEYEDEDENPGSSESEKEQQRVKAVIEAVPELVTYDDSN